LAAAIPPEPGLAKINTMAGLEKIKEEEYDQAAKRFERALEQTSPLPNSADEWNTKGISCHGLRKYDDAIICFDEAIRIDRDFINAWYNKGLSLRNLGNIHEALRCFNFALFKDPNYAEAHNVIGLIHDQLGEYDKAIERFDIVIGLTAARPDQSLCDYAWNNRVISTANKGKLKKALLDFNTRWPNPDKVYLLDTKAFILNKMGSYEKSIEEFDRATKLEGGKKDAQLWHHYGNAFHKNGKLADALECYDEAIEIDSEFAEAHNDKAVVLSKLENFESAGSELKRALIIKPMLLEAHENMVKFSLRETHHPTFWEFWTTSQSRKIIGSIIGTVAIILILLPILSLTTQLIPQMIETKQVNTTSVSNKLTTITTTTSQGPLIPESYLIAAGLLVLIILSPVIRTAKVGPLEFTLMDIQRQVQPIAEA
jgi:tetratricopeptide (TPR) repeat protein